MTTGPTSLPMADGWAYSLPPRDIIAIYETLLGRTPSAEEVMAQRTATSDWRLLLSAVAGSDEFHRRHEGAMRTDADRPARANVWHPDLVEFGHAPGTWSQDGEAVVGHDGWIFLAHGTNSVADQHRAGFELPNAWAQSWADAIGVRREEAQAAGADAVFVVVPDKLSVLSEEAADVVAMECEPPAAVLSTAVDPGLIYPVGELRAIPGGAYLRTDTHLALVGNLALATRLLADIENAPMLPSAEELATIRYLSSGDLGSRFAPAIVEVMTTPGSYLDASVVEDNRAKVAAAGRHIGTRRVLRNEEADDPRTVVVFGDSYGFADAHYQGVAWMFAQVFREVHFVWSPFGWDREYVEKAAANIVVCETAERFVPRPPPVRDDVSELMRRAIGS